MKPILYARCSMRLIRYGIFLCFLSFPLIPEAVSAATQNVYFAPDSLVVSKGIKSEFDLYYDVPEGFNQTTGLGISIHFNSNIIESLQFDNIYAYGLTGRDLLPQMDINDLDNDPSTDKYYVIAWADLNSRWPAGNSLPLILSHISFTTITSLASPETKINVNSTSNPIGYKFNGNSFLLNILP